MDLSICITIKNRTIVDTEHGIITPFINCLESINSSLCFINKNKNIEIVIADWCSTDKPIKETVENTLTINPHVHIINIESDGFSIGKGRNIAAEHAQSNRLLFIDADVIVNKQLLESCMSLNYDVFFPKVFYQSLRNGPYSIHTGAGNLAIKKHIFNEYGKWPEYWSYGWEDIDFAQLLMSNKNDKILKCKGSDEEALMHPWHPQNSEWKFKYYKPTELQQDKVNERKEYWSNTVDKELESFKLSIGNALYNNNNVTKELK